MKNLASGLIPIENRNNSNIWVDAGVSTNGTIINYDGNNGFSYSTWPCTFTLDLEKSTKIGSINFLLWDGLGKNSQGNKDSRKYEFFSCSFRRW